MRPYSRRQHPRQAHSESIFVVYHAPGLYLTCYNPTRDPMPLNRLCEVQILKLFLIFRPKMEGYV